MNIAYIDSQNMHLSTKRDAHPWRVDMEKLRDYLLQRYKAQEAYLFLGRKEKSYRYMYRRFREYGYELVFREHDDKSMSAKKGNVDVDVVFQIMRDVKDRKDLDRVILISGDGDYKRMVDYLVSIDRLGKVLFPSKRNTSALYRQIPDYYKAYMSTKTTREQLRYRMEV